MESGGMDAGMDMDERRLPMATIISVNINLISGMGGGGMNGMMGAFMMASFEKINDMERDDSNGRTMPCMMENSGMVNGKDMVFTSFQMEAVTKGLGRTVGTVDLVYVPGRMAGATRVSGSMVWRMGRVWKPFPTDLSDMMGNG
jgi:hypothetical protein